MGGVVQNLKLTLMAAIGILNSAATVAGPFCVVVPGLGPPQCRYFDEASCARAATVAHGGCIGNPKQGIAPSMAPEHARFCLVTGTGTMCSYYDAPSCAQAAKEFGGTCLTRR